MKGFSFKGLVDLAQEAWNLATASVKKAGDTMTGNLTIKPPSGGGLILNADDPTVSCFVRGQVDETNNWYVGRGNANSNDCALYSYAYGTGVFLHADYIGFDKDPRTSAAQGAAAGSLTRKDYVDGFKTDLENKKVNRTGDTITGPLSLKMSGSVYSTTSGEGASLVTNFVNASEVRVGKWTINEAGMANFSALKPDGVFRSYLVYDPTTEFTSVLNPTCSGTQGTNAASLTRKDYVDSTFVKKAGDTMTGGLVIDHNGEGVRMLADTGASSYVRSVVNGANNWFVGKGDANDVITLNSYVLGTSISLDSTHIRMNKDPRSSAAQGTDAGSLTRKDYVDTALNNNTSATRANSLNNSGGSISTWAGDLNTLTMGQLKLAGKTGSTNYPPTSATYVYVETKSIYSNPPALQQTAWPYDGNGPGDVWQRNYSVNTFSWTPWHRIGDITVTAAKGNSDIVAGSYGQVGTYATMRETSGSSYQVGATLAGGSLTYCGSKDDGHVSTSSATGTGTWKCLGFSDGSQQTTTLWIRIA